MGNLSGADRASAEAVRAAAGPLLPSRCPWIDPILGKQTMPVFADLQRQVRDLIHHSPQDSEIASDRLYQVQVEATELCIRLAREGRFDLVPKLADVRLTIKPFERRKKLWALFSPITSALASRYPHEDLQHPHDAFEWTMVCESGGHGVQTAERWLAMAEWLDKVLGLLANTFDRPTQSTETFVPTDSQAAMMVALASATTTVDQNWIAGKSGYCRDAVKADLPRLEAVGMVHRPHGAKRGYALTDSGQTWVQTHPNST